MATGLALAYYVKSGAGVAGLTVSVTVVSVALADLTEAVIVNAQPMTASANLAGMYRYRVPNLDFQNYWYTFKAITAGDVDEKELAGLLYDLTTVEMTAYGVGTADPGDAMALTPAERSTTAMVFWNILTTALTTMGSIGKFFLDVLSAIQAKTDLLGTTTVAVVSPVRENGDVEITGGDSYLNVDGRRLTWTVATWNIAETSTVVVIVYRAVALPAVRISATSVGLELTSAQSAALPEGDRDFWIQEIKADGSGPITHQTGMWTTNKQPTPAAE